MSEIPGNMKRVRRKAKTSQNPLFEKWLLEWKQEAAKNGSELQYCYGKALRSLQKYPFTLHSGKECIILENFGAKLCQMLDKKLEEYKTDNPDDEIFRKIDRVLDQQANQDEAVDNVKVVSKVKKRKNDVASPGVVKRKISKEGKETERKSPKTDYTPNFRSGGYAILLTLFEKGAQGDFEGSMTKSELETAAQHLCDASFTKPQPNSFYTAWSSMNTLIKKELVTKKGNPPRFSLTEKGIDKAIKLQLHSAEKEPENEPCGNFTSTTTDILNPTAYSHSNFDDGRDRSPQAIKKLVKSPVKTKSKPRSKNKATSAKLTNPHTLSDESDDPPQESYSQPQSEPQSDNLEPEETIFLLPGTFDIVLLVDNQEINNKEKQSNSATVRQLKAKNVNFQVRQLKVGDFAWVCKDRENGHELMLPYVIERKRLDDFGGSIRDGRFHEQKFRLKQCGIPNLIYLVEKYGNDNQRLGLPLATIQQAAANTQIVDEFTVKVTNGHDDSMRYLSCMTSKLEIMFKDKTLVSCKKNDLPPLKICDDLLSLMTFSEFNKGSSKIRKFTVREMLIKHLLQVKGLSVEKVMPVVERYSTPNRLIEALQDSNSEKMLSEITYGNLNRSFGPAIAKTIRQLYTFRMLQ